jgi:hypothetical protein
MESESESESEATVLEATDDGLLEALEALEADDVVVVLDGVLLFARVTAGDLERVFLGGTGRGDGLDAV